VISAGAAPQTPLEELTALPQTPCWILGGPFSKERDGIGRGGEGRGRGREEKGMGEGKTLWICCPRKNFLATPLPVFCVT